LLGSKFRDPSRPGVEVQSKLCEIFFELEFSVGGQVKEDWALSIFVDPAHMLKKHRALVTFGNK